MREIKFRAWVSAPELESNGNNVYPYMNNNIEFTGNINSIFAWNGIKQGYQIINYTQYTDLKDKNGVEIYEGDIVRVAYKTGKTSLCKIVYFENEASFCCQALDMPILLFNLKEIVEIEVIGNIYENPELLNG